MKSLKRLSVAACLATLTLWASAPTWAAGVDQLRRFTDKTPHAEGRFEQMVTTANGTVKQKQTGSFAFNRPGKFRWQIQKPFPQLIVSDGKTVTTYDEDLEQASLRPLGEAISSSPAALLFGNDKIDNLFTLKNAEVKGSVEWLEASPKTQDTLFDRIRVGMASGLPVEMEIMDSMGQKTTLKLLDWKVDKTPAASLFQFTPPPGVDVIKAK